MCTNRQGGVTLIELIVAMLIVAVALVGVYSVLNTTLLHSADPLVQKQMFSIAEGLMEEILLKDFADYDNSCTAGTTPSCAPNTPADRPNYNDVGDYAGYVMTGIKGLDGTAITGLEGYTATIAVDNAATLGGMSGADKVKRVNVTVTRGADSFQLESYRVNYDCPATASCP